MIGFDLAALVQFQPDLVEAQSIRIGATADRHQNHIRLDRFGRAARSRLDGQGHALLARLRAGHLGAEPIFEALLLEDLVGFLADFAVHAGQDLVQIFHDRDLGPQPTPHAAQFQADDAAADNDQMPRHLVQFQRTGRIDDLAAGIVHLDTRQRHDRRSGGDNDILRRHRFAAHCNRVCAGEARQPLEPGHLVLLEQKFDAAGQTLDRVDPLPLHGRQVEAHLVDLDAQLGERAVGRFVIEFRRMKQCLGRDAAHIKAGAAQRLTAFRARDLQAQLRRPDRGHIAAWASADHQNVIIILGHRSSSS